MKADSLIAHLELSPHPEGGFYRRSYCSAELVPSKALPCGMRGPRPLSTAILFLLKEGQYSRLHRIRQDELWHFYLGGPLRLAQIDPHGLNREILLGPDLLNGQHPQYAVPAGHWFGATPAPGSAFSLVGCTVAPGFDFADLDLGCREKLLAAYPEAAACIGEFCPPAPPQTQPEAQAASAKL